MNGMKIGLGLIKLYSKDIQQNNVWIKPINYIYQPMKLYLSTHETK